MPWQRKGFTAKYLCLRSRSKLKSNTAVNAQVLTISPQPMGKLLQSKPKVCRGLLPANLLNLICCLVQTHRYPSVILLRSLHWPCAFVRRKLEIWVFSSPFYHRFVFRTVNMHIRNDTTHKSSMHSAFFWNERNRFVENVMLYYYRHPIDS